MRPKKIRKKGVPSFLVNWHKLARFSGCQTSPHSCAVLILMSFFSSTTQTTSEKNQWLNWVMITGHISLTPHHSMQPFLLEGPQLRFPIQSSPLVSHWRSIRFCNFGEGLASRRDPRGSKYVKAEFIKNISSSIYCQLRKCCACKRSRAQPGTVRLLHA